MVRIMRRVFITGGAGFIGSSLVGSLMKSNNYHVTVMDNLSRGSMGNISEWIGSSNFEFVFADMIDNPGPAEGHDSSLLQKAVDGSEIIFHLAANPDVAIGAENTHIDFQQNIQATYNLLEAIRKSRMRDDQENRPRNRRKKAGKGLIFTSSSTVYGEAAVRPTPENYSPLKPISLYGATKLACEAMISGYCHMFNIPCIIARLANIIGPTNSHGVVYDFVTKLSNHPDFLDILGNGRQNKSYLYIEDCVSALILLSEMMQAGLDHSHLEIFNVGSDDTITVTDIAQIIIDQLSLKREVRILFEDNFEDGRGWKGDVPEFLLDCSKLKNVGWQPKHSNSKDAVTKTCREYQVARPLSRDT
jgi:UDP-glucose 4-epimerase